jgi:hypothetical protein
MARSGRLLSKPPVGGRTVTLGFSMELAEQRPVRRCNKIDWLLVSTGADRRNAPGNRVTNNDRARAVLVSSADRAFKCDEETFDPARPDATLDFD